MDPTARDDRSVVEIERRDGLVCGAEAVLGTVGEQRGSLHGVLDSGLQRRPGRRRAPNGPRRVTALRESLSSLS